MSLRVLRDNLRVLRGKKQTAKNTKITDYSS